MTNGFEFDVLAMAGAVTLVLIGLGVVAGVSMVAQHRRDRDAVVIRVHSGRPHEAVVSDLAELERWLASPHVHEEFDQ